MKVEELPMDQAVMRDTQLLNDPCAEVARPSLALRGGSHERANTFTRLRPSVAGISRGQTDSDSTDWTDLDLEGCASARESEGEREGKA
eukprot:207643-Prorocentrum_minimum.AAC.2